MITNTANNFPKIEKLNNANDLENDNNKKIKIIGTNCVAMGTNCVAMGTNCVAMGTNCEMILLIFSIIV